MTDGTDVSPDVAVVGIGSEIMGDDGVGPHVVAELEETWLASADDVLLYNAGTTGFLALEGMSDADRAIVIDAIESGDPPGTIREYRLTDGTFEGEVPDMTMHDVSFTEALQFGRDAYNLPDDVRIIGVEPAEIEPGLELSEPVERAVADVIDMVTEGIRETETNSRSRDPSNTGVDA